MPQEYEPYEDDDLDDEPGTSGDSSAMRQLRKQIKDQKKALGEKDAELSTLRGQVRERSIGDVLKAKGIDNPKVARLIPADIDPTPEAIQGWVEEYGDVFGVKAGGDAQSSQEGEAQTEDAAAQSRMSAIESNGSAGGEAALQQAISATTSSDDLNRLLRSHGATLSS